MRRGRDIQSSLELMLDTITNTFGGVLFMAILVAILLQISGRTVEVRAHPTITKSEALHLQQQLATAQADLAALQQAAASQRKLAKTLDQPQLQERLDEVRSLRSERDRLLERRLGTVQEMSDKVAEIAAMQQEVRNVSEQIAKSEAEVGRKRAALASEIKTRTQTARLPQARPTIKREVALALRYGRAYWVHKPGSGLLREINTDDVDLVNGAITPKPNSGIALDGSEASQGQIRSRLQSLDTNTQYVAIAVWEDSFEQFVQLKNILVDLGIDYRLIPLRNNDVISQGGSQTPLVQ